VSINFSFAIYSGNIALGSSGTQGVPAIYVLALIRGEFSVAAWEPLPKIDLRKTHLPAVSGFLTNLPV
jgi:hypothetical protein